MELHSRHKISGTEILEALKRNSNSVSADRVWLRLAWSKFGVCKKLIILSVGDFNPRSSWLSTHLIHLPMAYWDGLPPIS